MKVKTPQKLVTAPDRQPLPMPHKNIQMKTFFSEHTETPLKVSQYYHSSRNMCQVIIKPSSSFTPKRSFQQHPYPEMRKHTGPLNKKLIFQKTMFSTKSSQISQAKNQSMELKSSSRQLKRSHGRRVPLNKG